MNYLFLCFIEGYKLRREYLEKVCDNKVQYSFIDLCGDIERIMRVFRFCFCSGGA